MFNLPWYAWLNVFALPLLWGVMWLEASLAGRSRALRRLGEGQLLAAFVCPFLYWNPLSGEVAAALYLVLVALILPLLIGQLGAVALGMAEAVAAAWRTRPDGTVARVGAGPTSCGTGGLDEDRLADRHLDDVVDLDDDESGPITEETVDAWMGLLFRRGDANARRDSLRTIFPEPDAEELGRNAPVFLGTSLLYGAALLAVLGPPAWMSLSMANLLG